jgi:spermidine/putrescine-binding protein
MPTRLSTVATAAVGAGFLGLAVFAGMATAAEDESLSTVLAACDYTDKSNCEDDGIY